MTVYVLAVDGAVVKYPYTLTDMRRDNPEVSFPYEISDDIAVGFGVYPVVEAPQPIYDPDTQYIIWVNPDYAEGKWVQKWSITDYTPEELQARLEQLRATMVCTPFQGKAALFQAGLLDDVESLIANSATDTLTKLAWSNATEWKRLSPMIVSLATALSLSDTEVDNLFTEAAKVTA